VKELVTWRPKRTVADALGALGLIRPAFRLYESTLALEWPPWRRHEEAPAPDGLPVPPARLRVRVGPKAAGRRAFLEGGAEHARLIADVLEEAGADFRSLPSLLDFGCGCGRIMRHWHDLEETSLHGTDLDPKLVDWCRRELGFADFAVNELAPPTRYGDEHFALVYAFSVFTHMPEALQLEWIDELRRVVSPGGHLLITTHGSAFLERLAPTERDAFEAGRLVVLWPEGAGTGLCSAYHPEGYVRETLGRGLERVGFREGAVNGHDVHLFRKAR